MHQSPKRKNEQPRLRKSLTLPTAACRNQSCGGVPQQPRLSAITALLSLTCYSGGLLTTAGNKSLLLCLCFQYFSNESVLKSLLILRVFPFILANGSYFSQDCKQIKKIKFLLFLNIKSNFIYINILQCYCMDKCEMCYIIKVRTLKCTIIY